MATNVGTRALATRQAAAAGWSQNLKSAWGTYEIASIAATGEIYQLCKLPKGAAVVGGYLFGDKLDSIGTGSSLCSVNIGVNQNIITIADNTTVTSASTSTALGASFALGSDAAAQVWKPESGVRNVPLGGLLLTNGPFVMQDDGAAYVTITSSILALTTGTLGLRVDYYMAQHS